MIEFYDHRDRCSRCDATAWEHVGEFVPQRGRPQDVIACVFCGERLRVEGRQQRRPRSQPLEPVGEFRFQFGRFQGMTFAEADAEPNGRRYLEVLRDTNAKLRERITEYLSTHAAPSA